MTTNGAVPKLDFADEQTLLPYPSGTGRTLLRLPILFYQMGLGDLMNAAHIMILSTRGRKSGLTRYTAIEYRQHGSKFYIVSVWGDRPHWYQNLTTEPEVLVQQGRRQFGARAEVVTNPGEALRVLHLFRRRAPFFYDPLIARLSDRERVDERTLPDVSERITIVRIDPTPDMPALTPVEANYGWMLPSLIVLAVTLILVYSLTRSRSDAK